MSSAQVDPEYLVMAHQDNEDTFYKTAAATGGKVPCVVTGLGDKDKEVKKTKNMADMVNMKTDDGFRMYIVNPYVEGQGGADSMPADVAYAKITDVDVEKWANAPADAKEFVLLLSYGLVRRPALILKNEEGIYDRVAIYRRKKDSEPMTVIHNHEYVRDIVDDCVKGDDMIKASRDMKVLEIAEDGSKVRMYISASMNIEADMMWHPKALFKEIVENVGLPSPCSTLGNHDIELMKECLHPCWQHVGDFQAASLDYLMSAGRYDVVFSHFHAPDLQKHVFIRNLAKGSEGVTPEEYEELMQMIYVQIDNYVKTFMHLLDEDWAIIITSDHAQVCPKYGFRGLGDTGLNVQWMEEMGFTVREVNPETGKKKRRIDWTKTIAVANREMHIYLNLKGRNQHVMSDGTVVDGIVDPADQYETEEKILQALREYRDPETGRNIIGLALRRKEAVLLGLGGEYPDCGDIIYIMNEGFEHDHDDSFPTAWGECDTYAGPIFIAAGPGIKKGFYTDRVIRQIDVAPTMAALLGVRMPAQAEGAPVYQIFEETY